jgi:PAS domain S-box-containing protein
MHPPDHRQPAAEQSARSARPDAAADGRHAAGRHPDGEVTLDGGTSLLERLFDTVHVLIAYMDTDFRFVRVNRAYAQADGRRPADFVGKNHFDLYPSEENEAIFRRVLRTGRPFVASEKPFVYPGRPERGVTYWDWSLRPVHDAAGRTTGLLMALVDVTQRVYARKAVEAQRRLLHDVMNVLPGLVALIAPDQNLVQYANRHFKEVLGDPKRLPCYALLRGRDRPCEVCHCRRVLETGTAAEWERTVPSGRTYHMIGYPFEGSDGSKLVLELGVDITEERRLRNEIVSTSEHERQRVGQDLHDSVGQDLTGVGYLVESLAGRLAADGSALAEDARQIANLLQKACDEVRSVARGLCPVEVREGGLVDAVRDLAERTREIYGIECHLECPGPVPVDDIAAATDLYRIAQEAVNNAIRHGEPKRVAIGLTAGSGTIALTVEDDGIGLPETLDPEAGMGLRVMRYRAHRIGGVLEAHRRPEGGTCISCIVHLPPDRDETARTADGSRDRPITGPT